MYVFHLSSWKVGSSMWYLILQLAAADLNWATQDLSYWLVLTISTAASQMSRDVNPTKILYQYMAVFNNSSLQPDFIIYIIFITFYDTGLNASFLTISVSIEFKSIHIIQTAQYQLLTNRTKWHLYKGMEDTDIQVWWHLSNTLLV